MDADDAYAVSNIALNGFCAEFVVPQPQEVIDGCGIVGRVLTQLVIEGTYIGRLAVKVVEVEVGKQLLY